MQKGGYQRTINSGETTSVKHVIHLSKSQKRWLSTYPKQWENYRVIHISFDIWPPSMQVEKMEFFQNVRCAKGCKWSSLIAPGTENPLSHSFLGLWHFSFPYYWPSEAIRMGSPVWKWKSWKNIRTKEAQQAANGPVWTALALKTHSLILFWSWENPFFPLLVLWGNKNWLPSMKVKKLENY